MRHPTTILTVAAALMACALAATAQTSVPLPGLVGVYHSGGMSAPGTTRQATFVMPPDVVALSEIRLVVSGSAESGILVCSDLYGGPPHTSPFMHGTSLYLRAPALPDFQIYASVTTPDGPFDELSVPFLSFLPPYSYEPSALLGVELEGELFADWVMLLTCGITVESVVDLTAVRIELVGAVAAEGSTWGAVKSLYR